jgi:uncharacterized protein HemX
MGDLTSPLQVATVANALGWPLAAGAAVVVWSKMRAAAHARRVAALERQLQDAYRTVEAAPVSAQLSMVVEALDEGVELAAGPRTRTVTRAGS